MRNQPHMPTDELARQALASTPRVHPQRLASFTGSGLASAIVLQADEDAWEGTEIDVLRTVL